MNFGISALTIRDRNFIILLVIGVLILNIIPMPVLSPILIVLSGVMLGILIIFIFAHEDFNFLLSIFLIGFLIRIFLSFLFYFSSFIFRRNDSDLGFLFLNDGWLYSKQGWQISRFAERGIRIPMEEYLSNLNMPIFSGNITVYDYFTSYIYSITGYSPVSLFFISSLAGSLAALFVYLITKELFSKNVARISSLFAFFWPSFILWSTQNVKEPMIFMFASILIWTVFYMHRHPSPGFLLLSFVSIWGLFKIGLPYFAIIAGVFLILCLFLILEHLFKHRFISILIIGLLFFAGFHFFIYKALPWMLKDTAYNIGYFNSIFEFLNYHRSVRAFGRLQFLRSADISSFGRAISFAPLGLLYAIFAPFPWQIGSLMQIIVIPETILFYALIPFTIRGVVFACRNRFNQSIWLLSIITAMLLFLALVEGNSGTLFRHRFIAFNLLFIFTAIGISLKKQRAYEI